MKKNYAYYENPKISSFKELMNLSILNPEDIAFSYLDKNKIKVSKTYQEFYDEVRLVSNYMANLYNNKHLGLIGNNSYEFLVIFMSIVISGNCAVIIDKDLDSNDIKKMLKNTNTNTCFYSKEYCDNLSGIGSKMYPIEEIDTYKSEKDFIRFTNPKDCRVIFFTSGTTGFNKAVMLSEENICFDIWSLASLFKPNGAVYAVLPFHHSFGLITGILKPFYYHEPIFINSSLKSLQKEMKLASPNTMFVVPVFIETFYKSIWAMARRTKQDKKLKLGLKLSNSLLKVGIDIRAKLFKSIRDEFGGNLEYFICGGAYLDSKYVKWFRSIGIEILNGYGITECSPVVAVNRNFYGKDGSVGLVGRNIEVKVVDGEILVKGKNVMLGYYGDTKSTKEVLSDGWFKTGDLGYVDKDGFLFITGRKKNLIILSNGENILPEMIEEKLLKDKGVCEVVVDSLNNQLVAYIYPNEEYLGNITYFNNLIYRYNKSVPKNHQISKCILRTREFKKNNNHKILRNKVMEDNNENIN